MKGLLRIDNYFNEMLLFAPLGSNCRFKCNYDSRNKSFANDCRNGRPNTNGCIINLFIYSYCEAVAHAPTFIIVKS